MLISSIGLVFPKKYDILPIKKAQVQFCKLFLGVHKSAANKSIREELGVFPLTILFSKSYATYCLYLTEINGDNLVYSA